MAENVQENFMRADKLRIVLREENSYEPGLLLIVNHYLVVV